MLRALMRFPLRRFEASVRVGPLFREALSSLVIRCLPGACFFRNGHDNHRCLRRFDPLPRPSLLARALNPAQRKWTLLCFTLDGVSASTSRLASQPASSFTLQFLACKQARIRCSRVLTCRSPIPAPFGREVHWAL